MLYIYRVYSVYTLVSRIVVVVVVVVVFHCRLFLFENVLYSRSCFSFRLCLISRQANRMKKEKKKTNTHSRVTRIEEEKKTNNETPENTKAIRTTRNLNKTSASYTLQWPNGTRCQTNSNRIQTEPHFG